MNTRCIYTPTGEVFENRKAAKTKMGHYNYDRALRAGVVHVYYDLWPNRYYYLKITLKT